MQFAIMSAPGVLDIIVGHLSKASSPEKVRKVLFVNPTEQHRRASQELAMHADHSC